MTLCRAVKTNNFISKECLFLITLYWIKIQIMESSFVQTAIPSSVRLKLLISIILNLMASKIHIFNGWCWDVQCKWLFNKRSIWPIPTRNQLGSRLKSTIAKNERKTEVWKRCFFYLSFWIRVRLNFCS